MTFLILACALAFLLGSILGGQILSQIRRIDLRNTGSGNIGATNALRAGGAKFGLAVLAIDMGKGILAVVAIPPLFADLEVPFQTLAFGCGMAAILGHIYSPWARFSGGKGAATALGAAAVLLPMGTVFALLAFLISLTLTGFVGLSMIIAHATLLAHTALGSTPDVATIATGYAALGLGIMIWTHRENLQRVIQGTENRFDKVMLLRRTSAKSSSSQDRSDL